jgi:MoxR-like ATPase
MEQAEQRPEPATGQDRGAHAAFTRLREVANEQIIGQQRLMDRLLIALLSNGHLLVEGAPGLAKTTAIKVIAGRPDGNGNLPPAGREFRVPAGTDLPQPDPC